MNRARYLLVVSLFACVLFGLRSSGETNCTEPTAQRKVKRVGMVIGIKPEHIEEYKKLHAVDKAGVRDLLNKYHMHNFSIFLQRMPDGKWYEFGYYEYTGDDFEGDMAQLAKEPRNIEWLKLCDPLQVPLPGQEGWTEMEQVYFNP